MSAATAAAAAAGGREADDTSPLFTRRAWLGLAWGAFSAASDAALAATGTDVPGYLSESPAMSAFTLQDSAVYQTYATAGRGVEFLMGYYPILDRAPKGRGEGDAFQTWICRHDEYV